MKTKITNTEQLTEFIRKTKLTFDQYQQIIKAYSGTVFFACTHIEHKENDTDRENLAALLENKKQALEKGQPMFFILGEPVNTYSKNIS